MEADALAPEATKIGTKAIRAPAKINLSLHVVGLREDGYHRIDGLVAFADHGDELTIEPSHADRLTIVGAFSAGLSADDDNLVLRALRLARRIAEQAGDTIPPLAIHLEKRLPVASGVGGGSADAAALLSILLADHPHLRDAVAREAVTLGADVPMCLDGFAARVSGIGEMVEPVAAFGRMPVVLVNPGVPVETRAVFAGLMDRNNALPAALPGDGFRDAEALVGYLRSCRNDLTQPALSIAPAIGEALAALTTSGAALSRMSGSGATVFGLFQTMEEADEAAGALARTFPQWWVVATTCGNARPGDERS
ncbi:4-(cytidine 5'-diphospho)-2-C-methyl-D-erythritol kinase [Aureimonas mangrovi]|uniref:4-(cytidine 5'-diphospho)-2-C-methyl-D-erythritol kinase n=1 Tax=Aureimonas mangrovi TaxID=2758041 RepID=UPI00163D862F|nr:4-(cytidine 5'-diphospho)-2-C-methyl-D-erythritol kinase [Aureimonas mangrovi]